MINNGQTYQEYRATVKAYGFRPLDYELWFDWMLHLKVITIVVG